MYRGPEKLVTSVAPTRRGASQQVHLSMSGHSDLLLPVQRSSTGNLFPRKPSTTSSSIRVAEVLRGLSRLLLVKQGDVELSSSLILISRYCLTPHLQNRYQPMAEASDWLLLSRNSILTNLLIADIPILSCSLFPMLISTNIN